MTDGNALLAAILAQPDEDVPRLAYADWCDEHGRPERAEFIRVQCEMARIPRRRAIDVHEYEIDAGVAGPWAGRGLALDANLPRLGDVVDLRFRRGRPGGTNVVYGVRVTNASARFPYDGSAGYWFAFTATGEADPHAARVKELEGRERELLDVAAAEDWSRFPAAVNEWWWQRGFVGKVKLSAADWIAHGDHILAEHPVQEVALTTMPEVRTLHHSRHLSRHVFCGRESSGGILSDDRAMADFRGDARQLITDQLLKHEWPAVKAWHLPPAIRGEDLMRMWERFQPDAELLEMIDRASWAAMNNAIMPQLTASRYHADVRVTPELLRDSAIDLG